MIYNELIKSGHHMEIKDDVLKIYKGNKLRCQLRLKPAKDEEMIDAILEHYEITGYGDDFVFTGDIVETLPEFGTYKQTTMRIAKAMKELGADKSKKYGQRCYRGIVKKVSKR